MPSDYSSTQPGEFRAAYHRFHELLGEMTANVVLQVLASTLRKVSEPLHEQVRVVLNQRDSLHSWPVPKIARRVLQNNYQHVNDG